MRVSVIIPAWNLWQMTAACLRSLATHSAGQDLEVLVVDNGSTDATVGELEPLGQSLWGAGFKALRLPENLGFAKACNLGARAAAGDLLFFLNNDTTCTPGWLPPLRAAFEDARLGAAGPLLLYPDGTAQHCGISFSPFYKVSHIYEHFPGNHPVLRKKRPLQAITGAALMLRRQVFETCGGFFEGYRNGCEDVDFCFAVRRQGFRLAVIGESVLYHHTSQTPGRFEHDLQNGKLFYQRWHQDVTADMHRLARMDGYELRIGPTLSCRLGLPEVRERELDAAFAGAAFDAAACVAQLEREPLWRGGWLRLMDQLEAQGRGLTPCVRAYAPCLFFLRRMCRAACCACCGKRACRNRWWNSCTAWKRTETPREAALCGTPLSRRPGARPMPTATRLWPICLTPGCWTTAKFGTSAFQL